MLPFSKPNNLKQISWKEAVCSSSFKTKLIIVTILFVGILLSFPYFFQFIEQRDGYVLKDIFVESIKPVDVSIPIFLSIWSITILLAIRCIKHPMMFLTALYGFIVLTLMRMGTITLIPLNPPAGLIPLIDPISNFFYGKTDFITKDLFFSGHTSSQFLFMLCLNKRGDKILALISTFVVGTLVLFQHVHYTIDVLAAIPLTYICFLLGRRIALGQQKQSV